MSNKVVKAGIGYTIGNFLVKGINFLTIPIFARLLSVSDYGLYNTYLAYEGIFFSIVGLALQMSLKNAKYKYGDKYYSYISSILLLEILLMIAWILIIIVFHGAILTSIGYGYFISFLLIVQCTSSSVLSLYNIHLSLNYSFKSYVIVTAFNALMNISISILLILTIFYNERFVGRVIGTVIPLALLCVLICIKFWKNSTPRINWDYWKYGVSYSLPLIPHAISQVILNQFDRVMINEIKGAAYAGIYSFGDSQEKAWRRSLPFVAQALEKSSIDRDVDVAIEYKINQQKTRIDFLIYGTDDDGNKNVIIVELKQWSTASTSKKPEYVFA